MFTPLIAFPILLGKSGFDAFESLRNAFALLFEVLDNLTTRYCDSIVFYFY